MTARIAKTFQLDSGPTQYSAGEIPTRRQDDRPRISDEDYAEVRNAHPSPVLSRLRRAQRIVPEKCEGDRGEARFAQEDHQAAHDVIDFVRGLEVESGRREAARLAGRCKPEA